MTVALIDLEGLAKACVEGDLDAFASAGQLGWTLTAASRTALLEAVANTNFHRWYSYGVSAFTIAQAIGLISEAATNESGIAITEQIRSLKLGKEVAIAFRHAGEIHFGVRYASNLPMKPSDLWPELKPWYKALERNRERLERWIESEGIVKLPIVVRERSEARTGAELLAAVIAEPDEVGHRLVYADWLSGQGDARGELIQLCERRRSLEPGQTDAELDAKIKQLTTEYGERIAGEIAQLASDYSLSRGFVHRVEMSAPSFAKHGERLLASQPIEQLDLKPVNAKALARLARAPAVRGLRALKLGQIIGKTRPMPFDDLCASALFESLRRFEVWTWVTEGDPHDGFARWAAPKLERVWLYEVDSAARIVAGLARNELVRLRSLTVSLRERSGWEPVFASPAFEQLQSLSLETPGVGDALVGARLPALEKLSVDDGFSIEALEIPSLRRLAIEGPIDRRSFAVLLERHPKLEALKVWDLDADQVDAVLEHALALPSEHPLVAFELPTGAADPELAARVKQRFAGRFYAS